MELIELAIHFFGCICNALKISVFVILSNSFDCGVLDLIGIVGILYIR